MGNLNKVEDKTIVLLLKILAVAELVIGIFTTIMAISNSDTYSLYIGILLIVSSFFTAILVRIIIAVELYIENNK
jgi:hypothetical protein